MWVQILLTSRVSGEPLVHLGTLLPYLQNGADDLTSRVRVREEVWTAPSVGRGHRRCFSLGDSRDHQGLSVGISPLEIFSSPLLVAFSQIRNQGTWLDPV